MPEERAAWGRQAEFVLTLIGYAVGLGNVWRFPYLAYSSGGGAFLIPYVICLLFLGIPIFALEVSLGQFGGQGPITIWDINPAAKGLGMSAIAISAIVMIYYSIIIAIALRFLVASFTSHLPWEDCDSCKCLLYTQAYRLPGGDNDTAGNFTTTTLLPSPAVTTLDPSVSTDVSIANATTTTALPLLEELLVNNSYGLNCSLDKNAPNFADSRSPSEVFFSDTVLHKTASIEETGDLVWELVVCNLVAYLIVFIVLLKGIQSLGKVVYFTATFPYILLTILLIRAALLDGAKDGVEFYLKPDWEKLADAQVWSDAAVQIFFSLSACMGGLIAMSSYNSFKNNVIRDAFMVPIINCLTSFFAGFVVFCTLGSMAHSKNTTVDKVTTQGPGLVFVVYPEALSQMPVSPLWAVLFFFMVSILGFSTQFSASETVMTSIIDQFPHFFRTGKRRTLMRAFVCVVCFLLGLPMLTGSGQYLLDLIDGAVLGYPVLLVGLLECVVVVILYGYKNFAEDIKTMVGFQPPLYFGICWVVITPVLLVGVIVFKAYQEEGHPVDWVNLIYWLVIVFPILLLPGWSFYYFCSKSELTRYTPAWRARRDKGDPETNYVMEITVPDPDLDLKGNEVTLPTVKSNNNKNANVSENGGNINKSYVHHQEELVSKM
ncbi:sodium- and chloride-dependent glycine transporter 2-like [Babylonia areolata]|uniref:sodium- and chloride-dependent glycine transporter 2-like n=1 Tax=Babylonia areolata TaxID=304850 RepID=UPI003FD63E3D